MARLNNKGQFAIEAVLLTVIFVGFFMYATRLLREERILAKIVSGPWIQIQGMSECGVWGAPSKVCKKHPNNLTRNLSLDPRK